MLKRNLNKNSELEPSRGRVFHNRSGGPAPKLQFRTRSVTVVKNTSGSGFLCSEFLFKFLLCILPLCLFCSYYPVIMLGKDGAMNYELSLPLIWLVVFDVTAVVLMVRRKLLFKGLKRKWLWLLFPVWLSLTVLWSLNFIRGMLTVGILWLIYLAVYGVWQPKGLIDEEFKAKWWKWFFGASLVACAWCVVQCVLDLVGVSREYTLLCQGCTYHSFGFPHPNGLAVEPQFMGNLLLAPVLTAMWFLLKKQNSKNSELEPSRGRVFHNRSGGPAPKFQFRTRSVTVVKNTSGSGFLCSKFIPFCFFILTATLFLTMSRGAIYAFIVGAVFMTAFVVVRARKERKAMVKRVGLAWGIMVLAFGVALNLQGLMAEVSPTNDGYVDGVARVIHQVSLGKIDIRGGEKQEGDDSPPEGEVEVVENSVGNSVETDVENSEKEEAIFDGYVEGSTNTRLQLTEMGMSVWRKEPLVAMFGVGLGGAGQALYVNNLVYTPKEIVQNEYASLLLETGVVGISLLVLTLVLIVMAVWKKHSVGTGLVLTLIVTYAITLLFFAGLPNVLQIYLLPGIVMAMLPAGVKRR